MKADVERYLRMPHLRFGISTGCREQEICRLRCDWEVEIAESKTSVFILPADVTKPRVVQAPTLMVVRKT